ncbi:hypothetical protein ROT00_07375 [Agromyces mediolanus]|uniref:hypothetical protein n=1 Tax=Agromyces mediolanus TaxID=41986 RepID=UPI00383923EC
MAAGKVGAPLTEILAGDVPVFLVHKGVQNAKRLGEVFGALGTLHGDTLGIGTIARLPNERSNIVERYLKGHRNVPLRLADPELHRAPGSGWEGAGPLTGYAAKWEYLATVPDRPKNRWVRSVLKAQADHGASALLSASGWVSEVEATKSLARAMTFVSESREIAEDRPMFASLTLDGRWLSDPGLRGKLLHEMVESPEKNWYLRFYWPEIQVRYGQLTDPAILEGYKELATTAAVEDRTLLLPGTGLTGWVASALGATGFSTGTSWGEQAFSKPRVMGGRKGMRPPPRVPRYFDWALLHTVEYQEYLRLRELDGHEDYESPFSLELETHGHAHDLNGLHYLMAAAALQAELNARRPSVVALRRVRSAKSFLDGLRRLDQPSGQNRPQHLDAWEDLLS